MNAEGFKELLPLWARQEMLVGLEVQSWEAGGTPSRTLFLQNKQIQCYTLESAEWGVLSSPLWHGGGGAASPPLLSKSLPPLASSVERAAIHLRLSPSSCPDYYDHYCLISSCKSEILCLVFFLPGEHITRGEIGSEVQCCSVEKLPRQIETVSLFRRSFDWNQSFFFLWA